MSIRNEYPEINIYSIFLFNWLRVCGSRFRLSLPLLQSIIDLFLLFYVCQRATTSVLRWTQRHSVFPTHSCTHFRWNWYYDSEQETKTNSLGRCCGSMRHRNWRSWVHKMLLSDFVEMKIWVQVEIKVIIASLPLPQFIVESLFISLKLRIFL